LKTKFALFVQNIYYLGFLIETKKFLLRACLLSKNDNSMVG